MNPDSKPFAFILMMACGFLGLASLGDGFWVKLGIQSGDLFGSWQHLGFRNFCHQDISRSYALFERPMAVCSRCFGIYIGLFFAALIGYFARNLVFKSRIAALSLFLVSGVIIVLDVIFNYSTLLQNTLFSRWITGLLFGISVIFFILQSTTKKS